MEPSFMFATGIENSSPTIGHGRVRRDQMAECGHYKHWKTDLALVRQLGLRYLRYGLPLHTTYLGPGRFDWSFADEVFGEMRRIGIDPIVDLCHFGVPDWIGDFQNPDFPELFAEYARAHAARYPWHRLYTPINEMYVCARLSALWGWWNEQLQSDRAFVTCLKHLVRANALAMRIIAQARPDAVFIQSESTEYFHADAPEAEHLVKLSNERRFLSLDLNYGRHLVPEMYTYVFDNGMTEDEYRFFLDQAQHPHCVLGTDYYHSNEHEIGAEGEIGPSDDLFGYTVIARQYQERYGLPLMHTETNLDQGPRGCEAVDWLHRAWNMVDGLKHTGMPIIGFTWYSLTDQIDWDIALREKRDVVNPRGLFDLDRNIRPVGEAYAQLVRTWQPNGPTEEPDGEPGGTRN